MRTAIAAGVLVLAASANAAIPQSQRDALVALHTSTGGSSWTNRSRWLEAVGTECDWYGVRCDGTRENVVELTLAGNNLAGPLPPAIGGLTRLRNLSVSGNKLTGPIPGEIGALANLETLFAKHNGLTGPPPRELGSLAKLVVLALADNRLDGSIPTDLSRLTALQELDLSGNRFTGAIPRELGELPALTDLNLAGNDLEAPIPPELGRLAKLEHLSLSDNKLTGALPAGLFDATALVHLDAAFNRLDGPVPAAISRLRNLEDLDLSVNKLTGAIPKELGDLAKLRGLLLFSNTLSGPIPPELFRATALEVLSIGSNALTDPIPREVGALTNLRRLSINNASITGTIPIEVTTLAKLEVLELQTNRLTGPIPPEVGRLTALRELALSENDLTGEIPTSLGSLASLQTLHLYTNRLDGPIPPQLGSLVRLEELQLSGNDLTGTIPDELRALKSLRAIGVSGNALTGAIPSWIGELTALQELFVSGNRLTGEIPPGVGFLTRLESFDASENDLTGTLPDFSRLKALVGFRAEENRIRGPLPASIGGATELTDIRLAWNELSGPLPAELSALTKLETLSIRANGFDGALPRDLPRSVVTLSVGANRFSGAIPKEIGLLTQLRELDLSDNAFRGPVPAEITALAKLVDGQQDFTYNALFTTDAVVAQFLERKQVGRDWQSTQTVKPANVRVAGVTDRSATLQWTRIAYFYDPGGYQVVASKTAGGPPLAIATTSSKELDSIMVRNLEPATTYFFNVTTITHPHPHQANLIVSDASETVSATTTERVVAPAEVVLTDAAKGLVRIDGVAANEDSFTLTNFGDAAATLSIAKDGDHFTLETDAITIAGGASRTIRVRSVPKPAGTYSGAAYVIGSGVADRIYVRILLLSVARPAGTAFAEALDSRIEVAGAPGSEEIGTARFRNRGTATLTGVVMSDQPWVVPEHETLTIGAGEVASVNFRIVRARKSDAPGAQTATLSLVYVDGGTLAAFDGNATGISITTVTIVDVTKPPVSQAPFGLAPAGEVSWFVPGVASLLRGRFGSDLTILNASSSRAIGDLRLFFALANGPQWVATLQSLPSNQTVTLTNVVATVYNAAQGAGTLQVRSANGADLAVLAKMTTLAAAGTFAGEMPVFRADRSIPPGEKLYLTGLRTSSDFVLQEVSGSDVKVAIELLDANGSAVGTAREQSLGALGLLELRDFAPANAITAIITNQSSSRGRIVAFARVTDDATGDPWSVVDWSRLNRFALAEPMRVPLAQRAMSGAPGGKRRSVRGAAVVQPGGTDLTLFNPTAAEVRAAVQVISANGRTSERELTIGAMKTVTLTNAVTTTDAPTAHIVVRPIGRSAQVVVTARTRSGSSGTAVPVVSAVEGLRVGQLRSFAGIDDSTSATVVAAAPATFTTAYGFVETAGEAVRVRARLFVEKERSIVTATVYRDFDLGPRQQVVLPEVVRSFAGETRDSAFGDLHNLRLQIEVLEGKGAIVPFVVTTDNGSGDTLMRVQ